MSRFAGVSDILWRERELLDVLLFKLEEERLLLASGQAQWIPRATREIELVLEQLRLTELTRAMEVDALADELELPAGVTLSTLAGSSPSPWQELFVAHREAFGSLRARIAEVVEENRRALEAARDDARRRLQALEQDDDGDAAARARATG